MASGCLYVDVVIREQAGRSGEHSIMNRTYHNANRTALLRGCLRCPSGPCECYWADGLLVNGKQDPQTMYARPTLAVCDS